MDDAVPIEPALARARLLRARVTAPAPRRAYLLHEGAVLVATFYLQGARNHAVLAVVRAADGTDDLVKAAHLATGEVDAYIAGVAASSLAELRRLEPLAETLFGAAVRP